MEMIIRNPRDGIYAATPDYVHAVEVRHPDRFLFVSGTMGLDETGTAGADLDTQLRLIWSNLKRILADAEMTTGNIVRVASYLRDGSYVEANQNARLAARTPSRTDDRHRRRDTARRLAGGDRDHRRWLREITPPWRRGIP
jgi:enamine deaminase RidA (YjgF/YER057c/UK114 family)